MPASILPAHLSLSLEESLINSAAHLRRIFSCLPPVEIPAVRQVLSDFALSTEILRQRRSLSVFLSRRKKNSEKERPLRGFRREVRFIMSPPGKRRHNELNAAPPPETPGGTGKPGEVSDRGWVRSGESFCIRGKTCLFGELRGTVPPRYHSLSIRGEGSLSGFASLTEILR